MAIIGAGPAGLMVAEVLGRAMQDQPLEVHVFDAMPSAGRKFLLAGIGGLNLTHSEPFDDFVRRYGERSRAAAGWLGHFGPDEVQLWAADLGIETFVGSSGRIFPLDMKAAPLLRAWLQRLRGAGIQFHTRHRWLGWADTPADTPASPSAEAGPRPLRLATPAGEVQVQADAVVLALGGGSWAKLGSDGAWVDTLRAQGIDIAALKPANCGFDVLTRDAAGQPRTGWSAHLSERYAGEPLKAVALRVDGLRQPRFERRGEFVITRTGIEGSLVYAASSWLRDDIARHGSASLTLDLLPDHDSERVMAALRHPRGSRSLASHLKSRLGLHGAKAALLHEVLSREQLADPVWLGAAIKALPLDLAAPRPLDEAISTAGGVRLEALSPSLMLRQLPGVFCAGEMLDWEAPTGGYLLTACLGTGRVVGGGVLDWLRQDAAQHRPD
ncbi:MAG: TIGR03862 family flavoprotein [Comamonas sp.]